MTTTPETRGASASGQARTGRSGAAHAGMLIEGAAGSGKTAALIERLIELLRSGETDCGHIVVVTHTPEDAALVRVRIARRLSEEAEAAPPASRERWREAIASGGAGYIGSVEEFCERLLRRYPAEAGVPPAFQVSDEREETAARRRFWEHVIEHQPGVFQGPEAAGVPISCLRPLFDAICDQPGAAFPVETSAQPDFSAALDSLRAFIAGCGASIAGPAASGTDAELRRCAAWLAENPFPAAAESAAFLRGLFRQLAPADPAAGRHALEAFDRPTGTLIHDALERHAEHSYRFIIPALRDAALAYSRERREAGWLIPAELPILASALLREHPSILRALRRRWTHVLADDADRSTLDLVEILLALCSDSESTATRDGTFPAPARLFVSVGSRDRSMGTVALTPSAETRLREVLSRDGADVLSLNGVLSEPESPGKGDSADEHGYVFWEHGSGGVRPPFRENGGVDRVARPCVLLLELPRSSGNGDTASRPSIDAGADWIASSLRSGFTVPFRDSDEPHERRLNPGEILLVVDPGQDVLYAAEACEARGIPWRVPAFAIPERSDELGHLLNAMRAMADPQDPLHVAAFLRGPYVQASDAAMLRHARNGGSFTLLDSNWAGMDERIRLGLEVLKRAAREMRSNTPAVALARLCTMLGALPHARTQPAGALRLAVLRNALEAARTFSARGLTFSAIVERIERGHTRRRNDAGSGHVPATDTDGVRIVPPDRVRGMTAPVAVFCSPPPAANDTAVRMVRDDRARPPAAWLQLRAELPVGFPIVQAPGWPARAAEDADQHGDAARRAFSITANRVTEFLMYCGTKSAFDESAAGTSWAQAERIDMPAPATRTPAPIPTSPPSPPDADLFRNNPLDAAKRSSYPPTEAWKGTDHRSAAAVQSDPEHRWRAAVGSLLEFAWRQADADCAVFARTLRMRYDLPPSDAEALLAALHRVVSTPTWAAARAADKAWANVRAAYSAGSHARPGFDGRINLVYQDGTGWVVVAYVFDRDEGRPDALAASHEPGLRERCSAWSLITGAAVRGVLLFVHSGACIPVSS